MNETLADATSLLLQVLAESIFELPEVRDLIDRAIADEPPVVLTDGGVIRGGFDAELDEKLRGISNSAKQTIAGFEEGERTRTGISTLKVRFNNVFGYYIEVSKVNSARVPDDYERKQNPRKRRAIYNAAARGMGAKSARGRGSASRSFEVELFQRVRDEVCAKTRETAIDCVPWRCSMRCAGWRKLLPGGITFVLHCTTAMRSRSQTAAIRS